MELKDSEIGTCIRALDFYSRMYMGQYGEIDFELRQYRFDSEIDNQYMFDRKHIYGDSGLFVFAYSSNQ